MTATVCNLLLQAMSESDRSLLQPLEQVNLRARAQIEEADTPITYVYFPEVAVTTLFAGDIEGDRVTLALIGVEGMTGLPLLYGQGQSSMDIRVQVPGRRSGSPPAVSARHCAPAALCRIFCLVTH